MLCRVCASPNTYHLCDTVNPFTSRCNVSRIQNFKCRDCGVVFVGNSFTQDQITRFYGEYDQSLYFDELEASGRAKFAPTVEYLKSALPTDAALIDIGTGDGLFIQMLYEAGFRNLSAHELPGKDLSKLIPITRNIFQDADFRIIPSGAFDTVTLMDVLEHAHNPSHLIKSCARVLKPNGMLHVHTPVLTKIDRTMQHLHGLPFFGKLARKWQGTRTSVSHLQIYTPKALRMLLGDRYNEVKVSTENELSWPMSKYVRSFITKNKLLVPIVTQFMNVFFKTEFFNANKGIVSAKRV